MPLDAAVDAPPAAALDPAGLVDGARLLGGV
ncbi:hypothetical protein HNP84_003054 [Thermocatellispora tengchongensis]|uniref:Uncharacterized protein n=1 Tax=Thermocatellispora tengchongensis TaxID=1073253 RepID=A0A840P0U5_9ACTN|nr:hypothetical protein [Thermocatellispora tengchongensis]